MSFLIRASLVIGALSYLAAHRDESGISAQLPVSSAQQTVAAAWGALPGEAREKVLTEGTQALVRQMAGSIANSRDTLAETDRRPAWRGADSR